jgi:hypothetical protein
LPVFHPRLEIKLDYDLLVLLEALLGFKSFPLLNFGLLLIPENIAS